MLKMSNIQCKCKWNLNVYRAKNLNFFQNEFKEYNIENYQLNAYFIHWVQTKILGIRKIILKNDQRLVLNFL